MQAFNFKRDTMSFWLLKKVNFRFIVDLPLPLLPLL